MSIILDGTNGITFNNSTVQASAGQVLQVVNATYSTSTATVSTSYVDTGLTASITPKFATSKILVAVNVPDTFNNSAANLIYLRVARNSTAIIEFVKHGNYNASAIGSVTYAGSTSYLDSPATTSATTYKVQAKTISGTVFWCYNDSTATITLMEIAA